ncbi:MAG: hypothetical protein ACYDBB_20715 [Armatimonadota bacterium]
MTIPESVPSLIGYRVDEAEQAAADAGYRVVWCDIEHPRWFLGQHDTYDYRVGRQRMRDDGAIELLRVMVPLVEGPGSTGEG